MKSVRIREWVDRPNRVPVYLSAGVSLGDGRFLPVIVANLSTQGCLVLCAATLPIGETVQLDMQGCPTAWASVRWALPGRAGLRFLAVNA